MRLHSFPTRRSSDLEAFAQGVQDASPGASLAAVREAARRIPWVRDASVRRKFPDAIEVQFETHEPLARWADGGLVSTRGDLFNAEHAAFLPLFRGPESAAPLSFPLTNVTMVCSSRQPIAPAIMAW